MSRSSLKWRVIHFDVRPTTRLTELDADALQIAAPEDDQARLDRAEFQKEA